MNKLFWLIILLLPTLAMAGINIEDLTLAKEVNKEWCEKAKKAHDRIGFENWYLESTSKREDAELLGVYQKIKCNEEECSKLLLLSSSIEIFCKVPYIEMDKQIDGWRENYKIKYWFKNIIPGSPYSFKDSFDIVNLKLTKEELAVYYYFTNGRAINDPKLVISQLPEILRLKNAVDYFLNNGFSDKFYGESDPDKSFIKTVEFEYPSMSGESKEEAKDARFQLLAKYKRSIVSRINSEFIYNSKLRKFALSNLPLPISPKEGDQMLVKICDLEKILYPNISGGELYVDCDTRLESGTEGRGYTFEKYYTPTKRRTPNEYSTIELTGMDVSERLKLFGNYLIANTIIEFDRPSENKIVFKIKIDLPNVVKTYGKKPLSDFLVK